MEPTTINERLAVLETQVIQVVLEGDRRSKKMDDILVEIRALASTVNEFKSEMNRYRGFIGGVFFVLSGVTLILFRFASPIYDWMHHR